MAKATVTITNYPSPFYPYQLDWKIEGSTFRRTEVFANKENAIQYAKSYYKDTKIVDRTEKAV